MVKFLLWCLLFVLCWPLALIALLLYPIVWILLIPFRIIGFAVDGVLGLLRGLFMLPARILSGLRATVGLVPLEDPGTAAGRVTQLFRERAFWLWLTGHRLGDLRRLVRQYSRPADVVYPVGPYPGGPLRYGDQLDLPIYEVNNSRYDPGACDPHQP